MYVTKSYSTGNELGEEEKKPMQIRRAALVPLRPHALFPGPRLSKHPRCLMKRPLTNGSGMFHISFHWRGRCSSQLRMSTASRLYIGSVFLPAELFMSKEQVPLRHFNVAPPLTWSAATSRLNLSLMGTLTKSKGNRRKQLLSISHLFYSSFLPSISSFTPPITEEHNKNTIFNLKHSPCVKLDWKPLLKEITSGVEFLFFRLHQEPWRSGSLGCSAHSWGCHSLQNSNTFSDLNPIVDGQRSFPSQQVQHLGLLPAVCDPL